MSQIIKTKGAFSYLMVVFLNAFLDLGHKITIQNTILKVYDGEHQIILTAILNALILLPFILLFTPAGFAGDRFPKNVVMRLSAALAVGITLAITFCYYTGQFWTAFVMTFILAMQSAIYSPAKSGYIKSLFGKDRLAEGNGLAQATVICAILVSTFLFSQVFEHLYPSDAITEADVLVAVAPIGWLLVVTSLLEALLCYRLPQLDFGTKIEFRPVEHLSGRAAIRALRPLISNEIIRLSVLGLAVFWAVGQVQLAAFGNFAEQVLGITDTRVINGTMAASGIGIALGSFLAIRWSRGYIETGLIPIGAMGICTGLFLVVHLDVIWLHAVNFFIMGIAGGLFIVPLNALIQFNARSEELGTVIAGNNFLQNITMITFLALTCVLTVMGVSAYLFPIIAVVALSGCVFTVLKLPQSLIRFIVTSTIKRHYKIKVSGLNSIPEQGGVLLLGNHVSWIDWAILQIAAPRPIRFVMERSIYDRWYINWIVKIFGAVPIELGDGGKDALLEVSKLLDVGEVVCIFPEGTISRTGHLVQFRRGFERLPALAKNTYVIIPFYLQGLRGSQFSMSSTRLRKNYSYSSLRDLVVAFGLPLANDVSAGIVKRQILRLSMASWQSYVETLPTLQNAWITSVKRSKNLPSLVDEGSAPLAAIRALCAAIAISVRISKKVADQNVGLLLPSSGGAALANMGSLLAGKTVVNLNYTSNLSDITSACETAEIKVIVTSNTFLKKLKARGIDIRAAFHGQELIHLEELVAEIPKIELGLYWLLVKFLPESLLRLIYSHNNDTDKIAAVLFSSGSEGSPKGISLTHKNIMSNIKQVAEIVNAQSDDVMLGSLPLFHAFGLTVTTFLPLIEGIPLVCQPDPTDALSTAKSISRHGVSIMCGTSSLLRLYTQNQKIHPLLLASLRLVVSGAEKLDDKVRQDFQSKFGKTILEGYGTTETAPVASCNLPDQLEPSRLKIQKGSQLGTVGMPVPGTSCIIVDPETFEELPIGDAGMVLISGPQVMHGYLGEPDKTKGVIKEIDGFKWYVSGDKGIVDEDGFLTIIDRYSRFVKIRGEMISLTAVERALRSVISEEVGIIAVGLPDAIRGEKIVLVCDLELDLTSVRKKMLDLGCPALMLPSEYQVVNSIPLLGSGKADVRRARAMAVEFQ
ncbi:MAG: acyl-[ACP]--phospholipid O-acyltransferase [Porticoccaceae bacterium]|nr:acyl-[ACP]--phospholipid O-acyltransferase [Porticoccaceae bacterium]